MKDLAHWTPCAPPSADRLVGRFISAERYNAARDGEGLFAAIGGQENAALWAHIPVGPFESRESLTALYDHTNKNLDWITYTFRSPAGKVLGMSSYMRIRSEHGSAEIGSVIFSKTLQQTPAATEAMYLMARHIFEDLGYRRYEWKCNAENQASARAAERFGFSFEGKFRQDMVMKGRNRDTLWFSMLDCEWKQIKAAFEAWLQPDNFDEQGKQRQTLQGLRETASFESDTVSADSRQKA